MNDCVAIEAKPGWVAGPIAVALVALANPAIEVSACRLDVGADALRASAALLSSAERRRAGRFRFERDRRRFTVARARLRELLSARLGVRPESVELSRGARGKPELLRRGDAPDLRFNLSRSGDIAVYAFCEGREVGIDVESVRPIRDADEIASRFFSPGENEAYLALDPQDRPLGFLNCWTRKEAFVKALGDGLSHPLDRFEVTLAPGEPAKIVRVGSTPGNHCGWTLHRIAPGPGLVGAVVVQVVDRDRAATAHPDLAAIRSPSRREVGGVGNGCNDS